MRYFLIFAILAITRCHSVEAAEPSCFPGVTEPNVESVFPYLVVDDQENCAAVWFCPDATGHKWIKHYIIGHGDNIDNCAYPRVKIIAALFMTRDQKVAMWRERFVTGAETDPVKAATILAQDEPAKQLALSVPYPDTVPPNGWVTQTTVAYKRSDAIASNVLSPVGSVPLGTPCKATDIIKNAIGTYHAIADRTTVTMTKVGNYTVPRPTTMYGKCMP